MVKPCRGSIIAAFEMPLHAHITTVHTYTYTCTQEPRYVVVANPAVWTVHEQVAVAALDSHALPFAASIIQAINRRFPESIRAKRLQARLNRAADIRLGHG